MGCDGGTIPRRDELVRTKKKPEQKDKVADMEAKWKLCAISQEPLRAPIMGCELGRLYNKESVLEFLIDKSKFENASGFAHIRGLKDVKELKFTDNQAYEKEKVKKGDSYIDTQTSPYICPVVGLEMNGTYKFCFVWSCGCVMSERALKEIKSETCHKCGKPYSSEDIVVLNGSDEDVDELKKIMEKRRLQAKLDKKAKKAQKHKTSEEPTTSEVNGEPSSKQSKVETVSSSAMSNATASTSGQLTNGHFDKKSKLPNGSLSSNSKLTNGKSGEKSSSIQKDSNATDTYKSLFTTSKKAKNQQSAHWVTFNPFYN